MNRLEQTQQVQVLGNSNALQHGLKSEHHTVTDGRPKNCQASAAAAGPRVRGPSSSAIAGGMPMHGKWASFIGRAGSEKIFFNQ